MNQIASLQPMVELFPLIVQLSNLLIIKFAMYVIALVQVRPSVCVWLASSNC